MLRIQRRSSLVLSGAWRLGELTDGAFHHFGVWLTLSDLDALQSAPEGCPTALVARGASPPPCREETGCQSLGEFGFLSLISLLAGLRTHNLRRHD